MVTKVTPTPNTEGIYKVKAPFTISESTIYRCTAIRTFPELVGRKIDPYETYYKPAGLTREQFLADANVDASIVTLQSHDGELVYIPDTYIESYPGINGYKYSRNVAVIDFALVPETIDVSLVNKELEAVCARNLGIDAKVVITTMAYEGQVTEEQHLQMEAARKEKLKKTLPIAEENADLKKRNAELQKLNDNLIEVLKAHGLA